MHDTIRAPGHGARTFLVHLPGGGLADIRYAVTRFRSRADGDIVPVHPEGSNGRGKPRPTIMTLDRVRELCPGRDEIIIATGIERRDCGMQASGIVETKAGFSRGRTGRGVMNSPRNSPAPGMHATSDFGYSEQRGCSGIYDIHGMRLPSVKHDE